MFPHQFAEKVLELEINLEENHNIETIKALNELYGVIIKLVRQVSTTTLITNPRRPGSFRKRWLHFWVGPVSWKSSKLTH